MKATNGGGGEELGVHISRTHSFAGGGGWRGMLGLPAPPGGILGHKGACKTQLE